MANKTELLALEIGDKIAEGMGLYVVDAQYKKEAGKQFLRLFIDKEEGVGIDDCELFSRAFGEEIDKLDPIEMEYTLEVSSPGVDRKLKTEREFLHYIGRDVDVKLFKAKDGIKEFTGVLSGYDNGTVTVTCDNEVTLDVKEAAFIRLHFEF
ncbi:MAG: ribosome maturation factor RimP [Ruminococcaceae bacterium]|nr:ribosome maturation factor RimP [Oscillospiraceae bacterium]